MTRVLWTAVFSCFDQQKRYNHVAHLVVPVGRSADFECRVGSVFERGARGSRAEFTTRTREIGRAHV